ncbi:MAG TPA: hypothetical protein VFO10_02495 [Oligoflexus sp.]|uniref:hypothetical protein n=1 Tax=Oligoflexus sp. TaxID=1971216 RepID=UPI002D7F20D7|nr:hypothetical protein [Oligoflexus sp.]HET9236090.1 hypothetical protein [Oligoflexus sp.]
MFLNRISTKLAIVGFSFTLPIATMLSLISTAKQKDIDFAVQETLGNSYQKPLERIMDDLSRHRVAVVRMKAGHAESAVQLQGIRQVLESHLQELITVDAQIGKDLQFTADGLGKRNREAFTAERLRLGLRSLIDKDPATLTPQDYASLFQHIRTMITHAGDTSNLILDPDLDSYYLMDVSLLALPQIQDRMQEIAVFVEEIHARAVITDKERIQASVYAAFLKEADRDRIVLSSQTALNEDPNFYGTNSSMQKTLPLGLQLVSQSVTPIIEHLQELGQVKKTGDFDLARFRSAVDLAGPVLRSDDG